ncbi:hypothetical protein PAXRUDRAFT_833339 [Paxillus rubicundulus Ve08.2h10]|uniref:Uncharacterized protein n=1 Tax=Paxillus rubicundulus Ve08.2h10 TaxID=930991 RepID=A0A0D0DA72_9AGAM|nr:hypothetical protein PAXRUDRAFT_833339 [Paxillus rubicundulus Ve08.2h10]
MTTNRMFQGHLYLNTVRHEPAVSVVSRRRNDDTECRGRTLAPLSESPPDFPAKFIVINFGHPAHSIMALKRTVSPHRNCDR